MSFYKNILPGKSVSESAPTTTSISTVKNLRKKQLEHWTQELGDEGCTRFGARFHLRKLYMRHEEELSKSELNFAVQYLLHETKVQEQLWWQMMTLNERLEIVACMKLRHVPKDQVDCIWFSENDTSKDCILIYGSGEAKPIEKLSKTLPSIKFKEGYVFGNLKLPPRISKNNVATSWQRPQKDSVFQNSTSGYNKVTIQGPADYFILSSNDVLPITNKVADRMERENWLKTFGVEKLNEVVRRRFFEPGSIIVKEGEFANALYIIVEGECRASTKHATSQTSEREEQLHHPLSNEIMVASLGAQSFVGDISVLLKYPEPTTIRAITGVQTFCIEQEDLLDELEEMEFEANKALTADHLNENTIKPPPFRKIAFDTLKFIMERLETETAPLVHPKALAIKEYLQKNAAYLGNIRAITRKYPSTSLTSSSLSLPGEQHQYRKEINKSSDPGVAALTAAVKKHLEESSTNLVPRVHNTSHNYFVPAAGIADKTNDLAVVLSSAHIHQTSGPKKQQGMRAEATILLSKVASRADLLLFGHEHTAHQTSHSHGLQEEIELKQKPLLELDHHELTMFPTMTRRRTLHAKSLPILPKFKGYEQS